MITTYTYKTLTWIDLENPTAEDIATLIKEQGVHPTWAQELIQPTERAKTDSNDHSFFAVLHYPDHPAHQNAHEEIEIDYIVGQDVLISAHYSPVDVFLDYGKKFQAESALGKLSITTGPELFLAINNEMYQGLREEIEPFKKEIKKIEGFIFQGHEFRMVKEISHLQRSLLDFNQSMKAHRIILKSLEAQSGKLFKKSALTNDMIFREYSRVENALENSRELLKELRETNDSLLSAKTNDVTKKLTLMAFVTFPLTLVATVLEYRNAPRIFQGPHSFWIVIAILVGLFVLMQVYFKYKKWI